MTSMTVTDFARHLSRVIDRLEHGGEEIVLLRRNHAVAKLIPGAPSVTALDAFSDLFGILPEAEGAEWLRDTAGVDRPLGERELGDPWPAS